MKESISLVFIILFFHKKCTVNFHGYSEKETLQLFSCIAVAL